MPMTMMGVVVVMVGMVVVRDECGDVNDVVDDEIVDDVDNVDVDEEEDNDEEKE